MSFARRKSCFKMISVGHCYFLFSPRSQVPYKDKVLAKATALLTLFISPNHSNTIEIRINTKKIIDLQRDNRHSSKSIDARSNTIIVVVILWRNQLCALPFSTFHTTQLIRLFHNYII